MPQVARPAKKKRLAKRQTTRSPHPQVEVRKSAIHGRGLFAVQEIPRGTLIGRYEGPRTRRNGAYVLWVEDGDELYGVNGKNHLRFVNHSNRPNAWFDAEDLYAKKRIKEGEEITFHYGEDWG